MTNGSRATPLPWEPQLPISTPPPHRPGKRHEGSPKKGPPATTVILTPPRTHTRSPLWYSHEPTISSSSVWSTTCKKQILDRPEGPSPIGLPPPARIPHQPGHKKGQRLFYEQYLPCCTSSKTDRQRDIGINFQKRKKNRGDCVASSFPLD